MTIDQTPVVVYIDISIEVLCLQFEHIIELKGCGEEMLTYIE